MVVPRRLIAARISVRFCTRSGASPSVGSSTAITDGPATSARASDAHDRAQRGSLAGPVAADQRDHLALADRQRDALEDVGLAVVGVHVLQRQQGHRTAPRYVCCTSALARISSGVPSASTWP